MNPAALVFVHGLLGFNEIRCLGGSIHYFRRLDGYLRSLGLTAYFPALPPRGAIAERARVLATHLAGIRAERLYLIAHSLGGLDCRYLIHQLDPGHRVQQLVTVATPHRGSPLACWMLDTRGPIQWVGQRWMRRILEDLTPQSCSHFNQQVPDRSDVRYVSYGAVRPVVEMPLWLRPWTRRIAATAGENDGQVPLASTRWGEFKGAVRADHFELAGWNLGWPARRIQRPFDHLGFYQKIIAELMMNKEFNYRGESHHTP